MKSFSRDTRGQEDSASFAPAYARTDSHVILNADETTG
jgi:hypothetical protein